MLINNLQQYKEKYSRERRHKSIEQSQQESKQLEFFPTTKPSEYLTMAPSSDKIIRWDSKKDVHTSAKKLEVSRSKVKNMRSQMVVLGGDFWGKEIGQGPFFQSSENRWGRGKMSTLKKFNRRQQVQGDAKKMGEKKRERDKQTLFETKCVSKKQTCGHRGNASSPQINKETSARNFLKRGNKEVIREDGRERKTCNTEKCLGHGVEGPLRNFGTSSKTINKMETNQRITEGAQQRITEGAQQRITEGAKQRITEEEEDFLGQIKFHEVFFCCQCFKYIFGVEKKLHYPECGSRVEIQGMSAEQRHKLGVQRLQLLKQLSIYTQTKSKQIESLVAAACELGSQRVLLSPGRGRRYLKLSEIEEASWLIIGKLMGTHQEQGTDIFCSISNRL